MNRLPYEYVTAADNDPQAIIDCETTNTSRDLIGYLVRVVEHPAKLMVTLTLRTGEAANASLSRFMDKIARLPNARRLHLQPLSRVHVKESLSELVPGNSFTGAAGSRLSAVRWRAVLHGGARGRRDRLRRSSAGVTGGDDASSGGRDVDAGTAGCRDCRSERWGHPSSTDGGGLQPARRRSRHRPRGGDGQRRTRHRPHRPWIQVPSRAHARGRCSRHRTRRPHPRTPSLGGSAREVCRPDTATRW